jgi:hypothetical protein
LIPPREWEECGGGLREFLSGNQGGVSVACEGGGCENIIRNSVKR